LSYTNALRQEFLAHNLTPDEFAQQLLNTTGSNWRTDTLAYLRDQLPNSADKVQANGLAVAFYDTLGAVYDLDPADLTLLAQERDAFIRDTGSGFANALPDFIQKITHVAFNLDQMLTRFADVQLIDQAYAAELNDPRLSFSARTVIEEARETFQRAGQTVVVQQGLGSNPFGSPGFDPAAVPPLALNLNEGQQQTLTIYLPYEAGIGGQKLTLSLNGVNASGFMIRADGRELLPEGNVFTLTVLEGQKQLVIALRQTQDIGAASALSLVAQLVNAAGAATHRHDEEATIALADNGDLIDGSAPTIDYENGLPTSTIVGGDEDNVETLLGAQNYIYHGNGDPWARGYREVDGPQHISCSNCLVVPAQQSP
jgi:hypothetical protein